MRKNKYEKSLNERKKRILKNGNYGSIEIIVDGDEICDDVCVVDTKCGLYAILKILKYLDTTKQQLMEQTGVHQKTYDLFKEMTDCVATTTVIDLIGLEESMKGGKEN